MSEEIFILMRTNLDEVSRKTGIAYDILLDYYQNEMAKNHLVMLKIDENGKIIFDE